MAGRIVPTSLACICVTWLALAAPSARADGPFPWQKPHATVLPTGDLEWAPEPFAFQAGPSVRYIDFDAGDDGNPGTRDKPWKHHPWDPDAKGNPRDHQGPTTYVFKRGATYRGLLRPDESGTPDEPIRLTSDPTWGSGEARFYGSTSITGGWSKGSEHGRIPDAQAVWTIELDYLPRTLWLVEPGRGGEGAPDRIARLPIAREPDWTEPDDQDPMSEWYEWDQPQWWKGKNKISKKGKTWHLGIDKDVLTGQADDYVGGTVWTEWGIVMGSPYPAKIRSFEADRNAITFGGPWVVWASQSIIQGNRYYLEGLPDHLDSPGEWWAEKIGPNRCRVHLRLPGDANPNDATLEAGRGVSLLQAGQLAHVEISGLTFRFTNWPWEYDVPRWSNPDLQGAVVRITRGGDGLVIHHNTFEHVQMPVRIEVPSDGGHFGSLRVTDNVMRHTDHGAIHVVARESKKGDGAMGRIDRVAILRNKLEHIGWRVAAGAHGHAISVQQATLVHVAGNMLDRIAGWGISVSGGKRWAGGEVPLARNLTHHNRVNDSILKSCDWGAFYITQGGPHYIYNNVAINPVGQMHWSGRRLGYAYYMDGGYKGYVFNNIAAGLDNSEGSKLANASAFQSMISFENDYFNNTVWRFKTGSRRQAPQGSRERYLGNVFDDLSGWTFRHAKPAESPAAANEAHLPEEEAEFLYETNAYTRNVLHDVNGETFGVFEQSGMPQAGLAEFAAALASKHAMKADVGTLADASPLRDPQRGDFRPAPGSAAIDHGVRNFVPWGLYAVVGEWHFRRNAKDPAVVLDEHWYMQPWFVDRSMYRQTPRYPLTVVKADGDAFEQGPLEDWIDGALAFDGKTHAKVPHETIAADFTYEMTRRGAKTATRTTVPGSQKKTLDMDTNNFLIEAYVKVPAGHGGTLSAKTAGRTGYQLAVVPPGANYTPGKVLLSLAADGRHAVLTTRDSIADGQWHHVLAEVDRTGKQMRLYVDGKVDSFTSIRDLRDASLANEGDFLVGKGPAGLLTGTVEFLRVARGTLADARTTIGELYAWQFAGPFLRDFAGNAPRGERRDAGALEATD